MDRSSKQKINEETQALNDTLDEMNLIAIFREFHPHAEEYTFISAHGTFFRIDHILGYISNLSELKQIETVSSISSHNATTLDINYKKKKCKEHKHMEAKQHISKSPTGHRRNQKGNQKISGKNDNQNTTQNPWDAAKAVLREKFVAIQSYPKKQ